jgi:thiamine biosynthesis lipoprotein
VKLPRGARVDLGGIGKGLAADLIARGMIDRGARTALVGMGGDLRARGEAPDGAWSIPVLDPFDGGDERVAFEFPLTENAIVTSTTRMRTWTRSGQRFPHLIDPQTGESTNTGVAAVVASARDAWWAEGIAKSVIVAGVEAGLELADAAEVRVWLFLDDGRVIDHAPA